VGANRKNATIAMSPLRQEYHKWSRRVSLVTPPNPRKKLTVKLEIDYSFSSPPNLKEITN
jgi:hypothetical protein